MSALQKFHLQLRKGTRIMNDQTKQFNQLLKEVYDTSKSNQDMTMNKLMNEITVKLRAMLNQDSKK